MNFTDDDLKRLKERLENQNEPIFTHFNRIDIKALLARLEAAERCMSVGDDYVQWNAAYEAWCKAAGK
jgi:hypothetical protein